MMMNSSSNQNQPLFSQFKKNVSFFKKSFPSMDKIWKIKVNNFLTRNACIFHQQIIFIYVFTNSHRILYNITQRQKMCLCWCVPLPYKFFFLFKFKIKLKSVQNTTIIIQQRDRENRIYITQIYFYFYCIK